MSFLSNWMESDSLRNIFRHKLTVLEQEHPTAKHQGKTECCRSGVCCWRRPGALSAEDVPRIAVHLGISEQELFQKHLVVDRTHGEWYLLPARKHQAEKGMTGSMLGWRETFSLESPCKFLAEDNACTIHEVKPKACREFKCWEGPTGWPAADPLIEAKAKELGWDGFDPDDCE